MPVVYEEVKLDCGYRIDFFIEKKVVVEIKSVESFSDIQLSRVLTYLCLTKNRFVLLINFNELRLKDGIKRVVNGY